MNNETGFHERLTEVTLEHIWTKEVKIVSVESVLSNEIYIFWPLSGTYRVNLERNEIRARSVKAQIRHKNIVPWRIKYIEEVRAQVRNHLDGMNRKKETEIRARLHEASMPGKREE